MRAALTLFAWLALSSCSKKEAPLYPEPSRTLEADSVSVLTRTEAHHEDTVLTAAGALLRNGGSLASAPALRCWLREVRRPRVREACLLAWSAGPEASAELEGALRASLGRGGGRNLALALAKKAGLAETLSLSELSSWLDAVAGDPAWLRAQVVRRWLVAKGPPSDSDGRQLWGKVALPPEPAEPLSLASGFTIARTIHLGAAIALGESYCRSGEEGPVVTRCLRFLSALTDPALGGSIPGPLRARIPPRTDPASLLFARDFPERALLLEHYR